MISRRVGWISLRWICLCLPQKRGNSSMGPWPLWCRLYPVFTKFLYSRNLPYLSATSKKGEMFPVTPCWFCLSSPQQYGPSVFFLLAWHSSDWPSLLTYQKLNTCWCCCCVMTGQLSKDWWDLLDHWGPTEHLQQCKMSSNIAQVGAERRTGLNYRKELRPRHTPTSHWNTVLAVKTQVKSTSNNWKSKNRAEPDMKSWI